MVVLLLSALNIAGMWVIKVDNLARMQTSRLDFKAGRCAHLDTLASPTEAKLAESMDLAIPWLTGQRHHNIRCG